MLSLYRGLLHLYPIAYREEFGEEMLEVFSQVHSQEAKKSVLSRGEAEGLLWHTLAALASTNRKARKKGRCMRDQTNRSSIAQSPHLKVKSQYKVFKRLFEFFRGL